MELVLPIVSLAISHSCLKKFHVIFYVIGIICVKTRSPVSNTLSLLILTTYQLVAVRGVEASNNIFLHFFQFLTLRIIAGSSASNDCLFLLSKYEICSLHRGLLDMVHWYLLHKIRISIALHSHEAISSKLLSCASSSILIT